MYRKILSIIAALMICGPIVSAESPELNEDLMLKELRQELSTPRVPEKQHQPIADSMRKIAERFYRDKFTVETMRGGEIVVVTSAVSDLFAPNDTALCATAGLTLDKFSQYLQPQGMYKLIFAVHSDDTGSDGYLYDLTAARVNAILDYFEGKGIDVSNAIGFPMANIEPLAENDSRANRAKNRRFEVYIIPDEKLIQKAK